MVLEKQRPLELQKGKSFDRVAQSRQPQIPWQGRRGGEIQEGEGRRRMRGREEELVNERNKKKWKKQGKAVVNRKK